MPQAISILRDGIRHVSVNAGGGLNYAIPAADNEPERNTYRAFIYGISPTGSATAVVALGGAAGFLIRPKQIIVSGTATSATNIALYLFKRTTAYTGGTPTAITKTSADTTDPTSAASLNHYGTGSPPTVGTGTMVDGCRLNLAPAANGSIDRYMFQYTWQNDKAPNLRGAAEFLEVGMNGVALPAGGALDIQVTWTEEPV